MTVRPISGSHICLRCQLRFARRPARLPSIYKLQRAFQSTTGPPPAEDDNHNDQTYDTASPEVSPTSSIPGNVRVSYGGRKPSKLSEFPLGRLYGFRGHKLREKRESLEIDNLGKPAEVIVLRDHGLMLKDERAALPLNVRSQDRVDIVGMLEQERGLAGHQEVMDNINEVRPRAEQEIKTWEDVQKFVAELSAGFTVVQLAKYIGSHGISAQQETDGQAPPLSIDVEETLQSDENEAGGADDLKPSQSKQPKVQISRWMPGVSESIEHFDRSLHRGYETPEVFTSKARLAFLLLRDCWSLKIPTVENGLGETEIKLDPQDLEWMIKGYNAPLKRITQTLILPGEKIESSRSREVIRVTSTQERAEVLIPAIKDAISKIKYVEFGVDELLPTHRGVASASLRKQLRDRTMCAELSRLSETQVSPASKSKLSVSFVDDSEAGFFDRSDIAKQLLLASTNATDQSSYRLSCLMPTVHPDKLQDAVPGAFLPLETAQGLSWRDRLRTWARWSSPVQKTAEDEEETQKETSVLVVHDDKVDDPNATYTVRGKKKKRPLFANLERQRILNDRAEVVALGKMAYWNAVRFTSSFSIPGIVLHHGPNTESFELKPAIQALKQKNTYNFLPSVPNVSRILSRAKQIEQQPLQNIFMRFKPSPWALDSKGKPIGFDALRTFPNIVMRFKIRPSTEEMELKDVLASVSTDISDVMVPNQSIDVRFHQDTTCRLGNPHHLKAIRKFIKMSKMNDGIPQTPSNITLPIAKNLCTPTKENILSDTETTNVEYLFVGHEVQKSVVLDYKGWLLMYTSIQGNDASAKRSELRLRARRSPLWVRPPKKRKRATEDSDDYINTSFELATALSTGSTGDSMVREVKVGAPIRFVSNAKGSEVQPMKRYDFFSKRVGFGGDEGVNDKLSKAEIARAKAQDGKLYRDGVSPQDLSDIFDFADTAGSKEQQPSGPVTSLFEFSEQLDDEEIMSEEDEVDERS